MSEVVPSPRSEEWLFDQLLARLDIECDDQTMALLMARTVESRGRLHRANQLLRERASSLSDHIQLAAEELAEQPVDEHLADRMAYLTALRCVVRRSYAVADNDCAAAARWRAASDRYLDLAYGLPS